MTGRTLAGKVAIVTGGARGLGAAQCRILHENGARVLCCDLLAEEGEALVADLGEGAYFHAFDVASREAWVDAVSLAEKLFGPVSILVNNAGILLLGKIEDLPEATYRKVIDVNQIGVFLGIQTVVPSMRRAGGGSIINISSTAGFRAGPMLGAYSSSKFAVRGLNNVAAIELGPDNIRVNSVHPGSIRTEMTAAFPEATSIPIARWGEPREIAEMVLFLAGDAASFCTGGEYVVDGGMTAVLPTG